MFAYQATPNGLGITIYKVLLIRRCMYSCFANIKDVLKNEAFTVKKLAICDNCSERKK